MLHFHIFIVELFSLNRFSFFFLSNVVLDLCPAASVAIAGLKSLRIRGVAVSPGSGRPASRVEAFKE